MSEHLPFAMAWWHTLVATGKDMFGPGTADKSFGAQMDTMDHARAKVDAGFEMMKKLGLGWWNAKINLYGHEGTVKAQVELIRKLGRAERSLAAAAAPRAVPTERSLPPVPLRRHQASPIIP